MKTLRLATVAFLGLCLAPVGADAAFTQVVSFGDSLSDTGNVYLATGTPASPPYYQGHYSNGPIWLEYLAGKLGVAAPTPSLAGGSDYAWGGAQTGAGLSFLKTPNIDSQISTYLGAHPVSNAGELFTVWGGANDFLNAGQTNYMTPVNNLAAEITTLANSGAKNFLVPNLPLLGNLPATSSLPAAQQSGLNMLSQAFNADLSATLNALQASLQVTIYQVDINSLVQAAVKYPSAFGFSNVTGDAVENGAKTPADGAGYLFWDTVHPTTAGQLLVANTAFAAVPEPSSVVLLAIAGGCLTAPALAAGRRRPAGPPVSR